MHPHDFIKKHVKGALIDEGMTEQQSESGAEIALQWYKEMSIEIKGESLLSKLIKIAKHGDTNKPKGNKDEQQITIDNQ